MDIWAKQAANGTYIIESLGWFTCSFRDNNFAEDSSFFQAATFVEKEVANRLIDFHFPNVNN